jgi:AcrR family transcriptional regulator
MAGDQGAARNSRPRGTFNEERWDEVVAVAADVFSERGYRAATLRDVASKLGMLKGSLYYYIESKEDLLFEVLKRAHLRGLEFVAESEPDLARDPSERLERLIQRYMRGTAGLPSALIVSEADLRHLHGPRRAEIISIRNQIAQVPIGIITAGVRDGSFDPSVDPYVVTATLFRVLNSTISWHRPGRTPDWETITAWYVRLFVGGLRPDPPRST